jgi:PKD repeat protein
MRSIATHSSRFALAAAAALATAAVALPAIASANTFCVHNPSGCVGTTEPDLSTAVLAADFNGSGKDTIRLGPGSFSDGPVLASAGNPVDIVGASANETTLTGKGNNITVLRLMDSQSTVSDLGVKVTGTGNETGIELAGKGSHLKLTNSGAQASTLGIALTGAFPWLDASSVALRYGPNDLAVYAVSSYATEALVTDADLSAKSGVIVGPGQVDVMRSRVWAQQGVTADNGHATVADTSLRVPGPMPSNYSSAALIASGVGSSTIDADRITAYGNGNGENGVYASPSAGAGNTAKINLRGSVIDGFGTAVRAYQSGGAATTVTTAWSAYKLASVTTSGGAGYTAAASNLDLAGTSAGFIDAAGGDLRLGHDSALIDRGDPTFQFSVFDRDGRPRVRDGDGAGGPRVDIGAVEYQRSAPAAAATATPSAVAAGQAVTFVGKADDADPGETATYQWAFDDGASATGATAQHAFATAGIHTATLTVTDPTGLTGTAQASIAVQDVAGSTAATTSATGAVPSLTRLRVAPTPFRARGAGSYSAAARRAPIGTSITYTLSKQSAATFTIMRASAGRRVGTACRRPTRANRSHRACTNWRMLGTFTRRGVAGPNRQRFDGRLGRRALAAGRYRLVARALDASGMRSTALSASFRVVR